MLWLHLRLDSEEPLFVVVVAVGNGGAAKPIASKASGFVAKCNEASLKTTLSATDAIDRVLFKTR